MKLCIICVAITGSLPRKEDNPAVPISIEEQIESTQEAYEAGATICHAHVRDVDQSPTSDPDKFQELLIGLRRYCPGLIIQFSTGGRSGSGRQRGAMLSLKPDMASLAVGSSNFPNGIYKNPPKLTNWLVDKMNAHGIKPEIEIFDLSHIFQAYDLYQKGHLTGTPYMQFVFGIKNAMPANKKVFEFYIETVNDLFPDNEWCAAGIGAHQLDINRWCIEAGGHTRTGLEDNIRFDKQTLATSNAALVRRVTKLCERYNRTVASPSQARRILGLDE